VASHVDGQWPETSEMPNRSGISIHSILGDSAGKKINKML